jgi:simple sugar transport system ATP-binding protein
VPPAIRLGARDVTRRFGAVVANDAVTLSIAPGTVHAIVGENGAGKTTLMRILYGLDRPDAGTVVVDDAPVRLAGPADATRRGIGMVHQELKLVEELTLLENLVLGHEPLRRGRVDWARARRDAARLAGETGVDLDWDEPAGRASVAARQRLEILRLLYREADVLILDEPTAVLAPPQVAELLGLLRGLRASGRTIVFISHKLREVLDVADTVTALRGGRVTGTVEAARADPATLVRMMVGESVPDVRARSRRATGAPLVALRHVSLRDGQGRERLRDVSLAVHAGEIVGVAGVAGNGQDELVECVVGLARTSAGTILIDGADVTRASVAERRRRGLAYIPADRRRDGLCVTSSLVDNVLAGSHRAPELAAHGWLRRGALERRAARVVERYGVRCPGVGVPAGSLSGGNQQRLILGRELDREPRVLVASQPTRGVDVRGAADIRAQLLGVRERGGGVLLVSEELDELVALSDRVVVLSRGAVTGVVDGPVRDLSELGALMTVRSAA